jgi:hypothetical protein
VRKRVTAVLHDHDFGDLSVCTFLIAPGQAPLPYTLKTFTTKAWTNTTISFYTATVGPESWIMLDDVALQRTPGTATLGTECVEPSVTVRPQAQAAIGTVAPSVGIASPPMRPGRRETPVAANRVPQAQRQAGRMPGFEMASAARPLDDIIDLSQATAPRLSFQSRLQASAPAQVQVSTDGLNWSTIALVQPSDDSESVTIELDAFVGFLVQIRFVVATDQARDTAAYWLVSDVLISR